MKSSYLLWLVAAVLILLGLWYWMSRPAVQTTTPEPTPSLTGTTPTPSPTETVTVTLDEQNELGQTGIATLADNASGKLVVTLAMTGGTFTAAQPAHIHLGACPSPGSVKYPLTNVVNGKSVTTLDVSWADLVDAGDALAINVHKSAAESSVYTACADLPIAADDAVMEKETTPVMEY
jgi:hypothetical protein